MLFSFRFRSQLVSVLNLRYDPGMKCYLELVLLEKIRFKSHKMNVRVSAVVLLRST